MISLYNICSHHLPTKQHWMPAPNIPEKNHSFGQKVPIKARKGSLSTKSCRLLSVFLYYEEKIISWGLGVGWAMDWWELFKVKKLEQNSRPGLEDSAPSRAVPWTGNSWCGLVIMKHWDRRVWESMKSEDKNGSPNPCPRGRSSLVPSGKIAVF